MNRLTASLLPIVYLALPAGDLLQAQGATPIRPGFSVTPYLWMSSLHGRVGVGPLGTNVDLSFGDILDKLKFAVMGTGEYRRGHWVGLVDGVYVSLGDEATVAFRGDTGSFALTQRETIIQPMGGYTISGTNWAVDLLGGIRYWNLNTTLDVDRQRRTATTARHATRDWVDAVGGAAVHWVADAKVHVTAGGDGGGGGSRGSWQAYGAVDVDVWRMVSLDIAYRALWVDYDRHNLLFDTTTRGILLGATVRF